MDVVNAILVSELSDTNGNFANTVLLALSYAQQNIGIINSLITHETSSTEDVYVGNFFECVVPKYSDETFRKHFRLSRNTMNVLTEDIKNMLPEETVRTMTVSLEKKIHLTIWMLVNHAISFRAASDLFGLSKGTAHLIFLEICHLISHLKHTYIKWPTEQEKNENEAYVFDNFGLRGVIGFIDGCHIPIRAPMHNPTDFHNRKHFHSVVLQGVCDSKLQFIDVFVGMTGRVHDARIFRNSPLYTAIRNGLIQENQHILGDSAYPLMTNLLTPYRDNGFLNRIQTKYNKKHSGARSAIERTFGILKGKFRRLKFLDMLRLNDIPIVIGACCVLYNMILKVDGYIQDNENDLEENVNIIVDNIRTNEVDVQAQQKRNDIAESLV